MCAQNASKMLEIEQFGIKTNKVDTREFER